MPENPTVDRASRCATVGISKVETLIGLFARLRYTPTGKRCSVGAGKCEIKFSDRSRKARLEFAVIGSAPLRP